MAKFAGVYNITNKVNGHSYVGSSNDIKRRWRDHKSRLRGNRHNNDYLQNAWNLYGEENFEFKTLAVLEPFETFRIENLLLATGKHEYNIADDAIAPMLGKSRSEETKQKLSDLWTDERKARLREAMTGENNHNYGKTFSDEYRQKLSESQKKLWTDKHRARMSKVHTGKRFSDETKRKMSESQKKRRAKEKYYSDLRN